MKSIFTKMFAVIFLVLGTTGASAADLNVKCYRGCPITATTPVLLSFQVSNTQSRRMSSDILEQRSPTDVEFLSFVSQYKFQPLELLVQTDDGGVNGTLVSSLNAVYALPKAGEKARYTGTYRRFDAGRMMAVRVTCIVK